MASSNGKGGTAQRRRRGGEARERQAVRHAERTRAKAQERREQATGAAGWVADRAGSWSLDDQDLKWMDRQKYFWNPLLDYWFRMEIEGWENLPEPPALLIGIHSGAPFVWDAWTVGIQWWRRFGETRTLPGPAHDALMAAPVIGDYFRKMGVLPAAPDSIAAALAAGRTGFIRMAIQAGVPIVPIATVGGPDSMPVVLSGRRLARVLQLDKIARLKMFPVALQAPWGLSPAILPELPLPTKIRTAFQEPIEFEHDPERASDEDYVNRKYEEVQRSIQSGMDALARRRAFPLFG